MPDVDRGLNAADGRGLVYVNWWLAKWLAAGECCSGSYSVKDAASQHVADPRVGAEQAMQEGTERHLWPQPS